MIAKLLSKLFGKREIVATNLTYVDPSVDRFMTLVEMGKGERFFTLYASTIDQRSRLRFPEISDPEFRRTVSLLLKRRYPDTCWYFSSPDEYDDWTFHFNC